MARDHQLIIVGLGQYVKAKNSQIKKKVITKEYLYLKWFEIKTKFFVFI